ncbi:HD domain-containing protein 2 [Seminavis robusta]|uniref:HD domain-containing protein 2 n=1 Tax=Seminavis robusta TaxID=568900 RepID=A0A9N8HPJ9_9STRA|nr:HD domain-containing protein 2 [Seminavis robusta]|eukprot:Sro1098_g240940.1 HD domain-containing protein 2 (252) ;mRNA; f:6502-7257
MVTTAAAAVVGVLAGATLTFLYQKSKMRNSTCSITGRTTAPSSTRLGQILSFLRESDKLKLVERSVYVSDCQRKESSAEHSWHLAVMYMALRKDIRFSVHDINQLRMLEMLLVHDLVEVYAGDTPMLENVTTDSSTGLLVEDDQKRARKQEEEAQAAERLFSHLPDDLAIEFRGLWDEFELRQTPTAKVAKGLDKLHCLVQNSCCNGMDYKAYNSTYGNEMPLITKYVDFDPALMLLAEMLLGDAKKQGWI